MKILMIAPEPIFEPRGTPLSVVGRLKALSDSGHSVDLLTYPMGKDVTLPGVRILRIPKVPGIRKVKIGPSFVKLPLDFLLMVWSFFRLCFHRYDLLHTHEEAGFWGTGLSILFGMPHLYDMHSSLPQQLKNFQFSDSRLLYRIFRRLELWVLRNAHGVITICPDLYDHVKTLFPDREPVLIENVVDYGTVFGETDRSAELIRRHGLDRFRVALYAGTFEPYQGIGLLLDAAALVIEKIPDLRLLLVGGHPDQVEFYRQTARKTGVEDFCIFTGQVLPQDVDSHVRCAQVLLSPRIAGTNTPLKLYSYLRSGVPIVATRLLTHTQVLNDSVSFLTEPNAGAFARGIEQAFSNPEEAKKKAKAAAELAESRYSYSGYLDKLLRVMNQAIKGRK